MTTTHFGRGLPGGGEGSRWLPEENLELRRSFFKDGRHRGGLCGGNDSGRKEELMVQGNERSAGPKFLGKMREEVPCTSGGGGLRQEQGPVRWEVSTVGDAEVLSDGRTSFLSNIQDAVSTWK